MPLFSKSCITGLMKVKVLHAKVNSTYHIHIDNTMSFGQNISYEPFMVSCLNTLQFKLDYLIKESPKQ